MEADQLKPEAQPLFEESAALYRQASVKAGVANVLSNLGQVCYLRGVLWAWAAARHWCEALEIVVEIGDVPIGLEILTRAAKLWAQHDHAGRSR